MRRRGSGDEAGFGKQVAIDNPTNRVKSNGLMKNLLIAGFAVVAIAVLAALSSVTSTQSPVAGCGGCTNSNIATISCGGSCTNKVTGLLALR